MGLNAPVPHRDEPLWAEVAAIPIRDDGEALVPLELCPSLDAWPAYFHLGVPGAVPGCHVRRSVFERLLAAVYLLPEGVRLVVLDAWRPLAVQSYLSANVARLLAERDPEVEPESRRAVARQFVAPPRGDHAPSPHLTGGAVDVTLCDTDGRFLDMGTGFDAVEPASVAWFESEGLDEARSHAVRQNRRMLHGVMISAGFSSLPSEWWHYDYGNQLWAWTTGYSTARFGATELALPGTLAKLGHDDARAQTLLQGMQR